MTKTLLWTSCLSLLFMGALWGQSPAANGSSQAYGRLQFTPPAGWAAFEKADLLILVPGGSTPEKATVSITLLPPSSRRQKTLTHWLKVALLPVRAGFRVLKTEEPTASRLATGAPSALMTELLGDPSGSGILYQLYYAVATGDSGQLILYTASNPRDFERHAAALNRMMESVSVLKNEPARRDAPRPANKKPASPILPKISV